MTEVVSGTADTRPYFFLSYAHAKYKAQGSPGSLVRQFFEDLRGHVEELTSAVVPGFMDADIPLAEPWSDELATALGRCRVFVPVINAGYCDRAWCGKEWGGFAQRLQPSASDGKLPAAIVPVWWMPRKKIVLPSSIRHLQLDPPSGLFPAEYTDQGLYSLIIKRVDEKKYKSLYRDAVLQLAQLVVEAGQVTKLPDGPPVAWDTAPNIFAEHQARHAMHRIRVRVAAYPTIIPAGAKPREPARATLNYYYGYAMREWTPYRSDSDTTLIVGAAEAVISRLGHHALVDPLDDPVVPAPKPSPTVLLVDPWAPGVPEVAAKLRAIDRRPLPVVVPWNEKDEETVKEGPRLARNLGQALRRSLALTGSAGRVPTLKAFTDVDFPKAVNEAIARYLKTAPTYPPVQPSPMGRPSLRPEL